MLEFQPWPKTPRLFRPMIVTEKIDGTNAAVHVQLGHPGDDDTGWSAGVDTERGFFKVGAQSRKRIITPAQDNFGFAAWVAANAESLALTLGEGVHYGEWWGSGIQRGYGLPKGEKHFSLFNVKRYSHLVEPDVDGPLVPGLGLVPVLYEGPFDLEEVRGLLDDLHVQGSQAAPGFDRPEGVIVYHHALNGVFKATLENDDEPKGRCS